MNNDCPYISLAYYNVSSQWFALIIMSCHPRNTISSNFIQVFNYPLSSSSFPQVFRKEGVLTFYLL